MADDDVRDDTNTPDDDPRIKLARLEAREEARRELEEARAALEQDYESRLSQLQTLSSPPKEEEPDPTNPYDPDDQRTEFIRWEIEHGVKKGLTQMTEKVLGPAARNLEESNKALWRKEIDRKLTDLKQTEYWKDVGPEFDKEYKALPEHIKLNPNTVDFLWKKHVGDAELAGKLSQARAARAAAHLESERDRNPAAIPETDLSRVPEVVEIRQRGGGVLRVNLEHLAKQAGMKDRFEYAQKMRELGRPVPGVDA